MSIEVYLDEKASVAKIEIRHIHSALFGTDPIYVNEETDCNLQIHIKTINFDSAGHVGKVTHKQMGIEFALDFNKQKTVKQNVAHLFLKAMYMLNPQKVLPWGILTGIRPMKLYRKLVSKYNGSMEMANCDLQEFYLLSDSKIKLLQQIFKVQEPILNSYNTKNLVSLYIGIPFCPSKCSYCTFPAYVATSKREQENFFNALIEELEWTLAWLKENNITIASIYIGGGTPSTLTAQQTENLFRVVSKFVDVNTTEITFEAGRPDTITEEKLNVLKMYGVRNISINPQTFNDRTLHSIGRKHTVEDTYNVYKLSKKLEFPHVNMDLIIGLPDESIDDFKHTLGVIEDLAPVAVTIHTLALKSKSIMKQQLAIAEFKHLQVKEMVEYSQEWAAANGYVPYYLYRQKNIAGNYENVGYARDGQYSVYNMFIMEEMMSIVGVGCGAVSKINNCATGKLERIANPIDPTYYSKNIDTVITNKQKHLPKILTKL